jgi:hypothetical protein
MTVPDVEATADAFGVLADPVRVEILAALWRAEAAPLQYSALLEAVAVQDSGRFNYHLSKLTDHFVAKTDDGYRLRPSGLLVVNAVYAGSYVDAPVRGGIDVGGACPACGGDLVGEYDEGMFRVTCAACGTQSFMLSFPPRGVETRDDDDELLHAVSIHARAHTRQANSGLCPFCGGAMTARLVLDAESSLPVSTLVRRDCDNCGVTNRSSVGFAVLEHPAVAGFLHEHGVPRDAPPWRFEWCLAADAVSVASRDPHRVTVDATVEGAETALRVTVDEHGEVTGTERVDDQD